MNARLLILAALLPLVACAHPVVDVDMRVRVPVPHVVITPPRLVVIPPRVEGWMRDDRWHNHNDWSNPPRGHNPPLLHECNWDNSCRGK